jgi:cytochrome P450
VLPGGITIDGTFVPAGVVVGTPHYTIHHNASYYPQPFTYVPERWIAGAPSKLSDPSVSEHDVALAQSAFCPFSIGPRGCIGKGLAYVELMTTLARLLFLYDLRTSAGPDPAEGRPDLEWGRQRPDEYQLIDQFTSLKDGPMVEFRKRL